MIRHASMLTMLIAALAASPAAALSKAAEYLVAEQLRLACSGQEGGFEPGGIDERDLTGDGKLDLIIDHGAVSCRAGGNHSGRSVECGAAACMVLFYVRTGKLLKLSLEIASVGAVVGSGKVPVIELIGFEFQKGFVRWNGREFGQTESADSP
jgi:hypothetical protein